MCVPFNHHQTGSWQIIQTLWAQHSRSHIESIFDSTIENWSLNEQWLLDSWEGGPIGYKLRHKVTYVDSNSGTADGTEYIASDVPSIKLVDTNNTGTVDWEYYRIFNQFHDFLMYMPAGADSISVPISELYWSSTLNANRDVENNGVWKIAEGTQNQAGTEFDAIEWPKWGTYANTGLGGAGGWI